MHFFRCAGPARKFSRCAGPRAVRFEERHSLRPIENGSGLTSRRGHCSVQQPGSCFATIRAPPPKSAFLAGAWLVPLAAPAAWRGWRAAPPPVPIGEPLLLEPRQQLAPLWEPLLALLAPLLVPLSVPQSPSMLGISIEIIEVISYFFRAELHRPCDGPYPWDGPSRARDGNQACGRQA